VTKTSANLAVIATVCLLQACASAPEDKPVVSNESEAVPELTLNLPEEGCSCVATGEQSDYTFLEKGFDALEEGDYIEAVQSFQRYQRVEQSQEAQLEAKIAIAYVSTLSKSPFFDPVEARRAHRHLYRQFKPGMELHQKIIFMRDSLETFGVMQRHIVNLEASNATLTEDLRKREQALKRLRELALGQPASSQ
jgi:hypothetical protein